jgi:predicted membrane-bound spermidine synthase
VSASATGGRPRPERIPSAWPSYLIVFVASGCTLVLELAAGRLLAPFVGVSIHTWTSVIGVVLAGMSLGNYLGGVLADRAASRRTLGVLLLAGGLASLAVPPLASGLGAIAPRSYSLVVRIVLLAALVFFVPSLLLGMVPPVAIKATLGDLGRTGRVVGRIYAASTAGSLVGTFLTGFVLIAHFGIRAVVLSMGLTLIALGALAAALGAGGHWREATSE